MGRKKRKHVSAKVAEVNDTNYDTSAQLVPCEDTQEKIQTDAFKLMMNSRNKVIGSNSPGKVCIAETNLDQEMIEKKEIKAKRALSLQKMAQAKGAKEKLEQEESRDLYIKKKMENRADRLKNMIKKSDINTRVKNNNEFNSSKSCEIKEEIITDNKNIIFSQNLSSIIPDAFVPRMTLNKSVSEEDVKFFKKLSPSIRKKENMLCYFNVITKDSECVSNTSEDNFQESNSETIIKVKFTRKKKTKKTTGNHESINGSPVGSHNIINCDLIETAASTTGSLLNLETDNRQKRKRKKQIIESKPNDCLEEISVQTRPKRNSAMKSLKVMENALLSSSDEELHIFTPKKKKEEQKRFSENKSEKSSSNQNENLKLKTNFKNKSLKNSEKKGSSKVNEKKASKLAPIFIPKPQLTAEKLKAKQEFLYNGIQKYVKSTSLQLNNTSPDVFPIVRHIQQIPSSCGGEGDSTSFPVSYTDDERELTNVDLNLFQNLINLDHKESNLNLDIKHNVKMLLRNMKQTYPKFPVYRTYHSLKGKRRGETCESQYNNLDDSVEIIDDISGIWIDHPDKLKWTDKYKATSTKEIIGNFKSIKELRQWLITWTESVEETKNHSDSDFSYSDTDNGHITRIRNNLLILTGRTGSGKTSSVYAVASELSMKVIEVNASSKRTRKIMLQDLQEATQSHKVDRQRESENSQKSIDEIAISTKTENRKKPMKNKENLTQQILFSKKNNVSEPFSSQESIRTLMSLILIDDAHIVFEQDEGFCSAVAQIVHSSKRPVILVTESLQCPHLQKFLKYGQIIKLQPVLPKMLGTWLDIMCLADVGMCYPGLGAKLLDFFRGDIRKCINHLQYYVTSQKHKSVLESVAEVTELPNIRTSVNNYSKEKTSISNDFFNSCINYYIGKQLNMNYPSHSLEFNVWWSLPQLLDFGMTETESCSLKETANLPNKILDLEAISSVMDDFSLLDMFQHNTELHANITSRPWFSPENESLTEGENYEYCDGNNVIKQNISCSLMEGSIKHVQRIRKCDHESIIHFASMSQQREREKIVDIHKNLASFLNLSAVLDRKAVSLDYWSTSREICRMERTKTISNIKRNNRFCHYLKSINISLKNNDFDKLSDSLCLDKDI